MVWYDWQTDSIWSQPLGTAIAGPEAGTQLTLLPFEIVKYRDWLGGFISTGQYQELWGFDSQVLLQLKKATFIAADFVPKKIDLDSSDARTLGGHPYISYQLADVIISYQEQHGPFQDLQELQKIRIINDSIFYRISPYLKKSL